MGKSRFYKEFYSSFLKLWKMKGVGMVDGIYLLWSCFVQTIYEPQDEKK